jgi:predicted glycosyltransferase
MRRAECVVSMGGYNSVYEVLSFEKPALIVPRVKPRREQLIRAERLQALGLVDVLHPEALSAPALSNWLARGRPPVRPARERIDFNGLRRVPHLLEELLGIRRSRRPRRRVRAETYDAA